MMVMLLMMLMMIMQIHSEECNMRVSPARGTAIFTTYCKENDLQDVVEEKVADIAEIGPWLKKKNASGREFR